MDENSHDTRAELHDRLTDICRHVVEEFPVAVHAVSRADGVTARVWMSPETATLTGYGRQEFEDAPGLWHHIVHPHDLDSVREARARAVVGEVVFEDYRIFRADGQERWIREVLAPGRDSIDGLLPVISCTVDITAAGWTTSELSRSRRLLETVPAALAIRDREGRVMWCNDRYAQVYGRDSADEMAGTSLDVIVPEEIRHEFHTVLWPRALRAPWHGDASLARRDGTPVHVSIETVPLCDADGATIAVFASLVDTTEQKHAEEALRESEDLLRTVQNALPANVAVLDREGNIIAVNERWEQFARENGDPNLEHTGIGINYLDVCRRAEGDHSEGAREALEGLEAVLSGRWREFEQEYECPSPSEERFYLMKAASLDPARGGLVVAHIDTTDRQKAERALRESEEKYRTLVERASDGVVLLQDAIIRLANNRFCEMSGYSCEELIDTPYTDYMTPEEIAFLHDRYRRRMAGEDVPSIYEAVMTRKDGSKIELEINAAVIPYDGGKADLVLFRDLTHRRETERALRESEQNLRTLVENVDSLLFRMDSTLHLITVVGKTELITGYAIQEFRDNPELWPKCLHSDDVPSVVDALARADRERASVEVDFRLIKKDGSTRWVQATLTPQYDNQGNLIHFTGLLVDITERVQWQEREARRSALMQALAEISQDFASSLDVESILEAASRKMADVLSAVGLVASVESATGQLVDISVSCPEVQAAVDVSEAAHHIRLTVDSVFGPKGARPTRIARLEEASADLGLLATISGLGPGIVVPVYIDEEVVSVLAAVRTSGQPEFDDEDLWFLMEVASHASAALINARLYRRQSRIAETLQRSLIPESPTPPCLDIATCYEPAARDVEVGGDFFDIIGTPHEWAGIVIGDVAGKGLAAAVHTAEAKYMLRAYAHQNPDPAAVVNALNSALCSYGEEFAFVTLFYGMFDPRRHTLTYVNAGQEVPVVLCTNEKRIWELAPTGPILGVVPDYTYEARSVTLEPDDFLFCYTDGVTDARANGERYEHERLFNRIRRAEPSDAKALLEYVMADVNTFARGTQSDDQVVVVIRPRE